MHRIGLTRYGLRAYSRMMATKQGTETAKRGVDRVVTTNRRAFHDYFIDESVEAGVALTGTEIKSIRAGKVTISEAYARIENGELWLIGAHISPYSHGSYTNHDPDRPRKLLVHKAQIRDLQAAIERKGLTLVPLRLQLKRGRAKVDIGVARGKKLYDKRASAAEREATRDIQRAMRDRA
jgi:SsrA-binding protein